MGDIQISDLIKEGEIESIKELDATIERVKATYANAAKELNFPMLLKNSLRFLKQYKKG